TSPHCHPPTTKTLSGCRKGRREGNSPTHNHHLTSSLMKYIRPSGILFFTAFLALTTAMAADLPRLRLQKWATATHIFWSRALAPDRIAVSYFNTGPCAGSGLDVLDSSGTIVRRVWPLPAGTHC